MFTLVRGMSAPFAGILSQHIREDHPSVVDRRHQITQDGDLENVLRSLNERIHTGDVSQAIRNVQLRVEELASNPKEVAASDQSRKQEYLNSLLGVGYVRFAGWMNAGALIHLERDLDTRVNPRPKDESHVEGIKQSVQTRKVDYKYPIILKVNPDLVDVGVRDTLRMTKPFQEYDTLPPFLLNNISAREMRLSREIFWERSDQAPFAYFTQEELNDRIIERDQLRNSRDRATLVNGSHRVDAMADLATEFEPRRRACIDLGKQLDAEPENRELLDAYSLAAAELSLKMNDYTWQVIVFKDTTDPALLNELATNSDPLPTLPAGEGEKMWMFASQVEADMEQIKLIYPGISRSELFDRWRALRRENTSDKQPEDDGPASRAATPQLADQELGRALGKKSKKKQKGATRDSLTGQVIASKPSKGKGAVAGEYTYQRLTTVPVTFEMLLANKACIWPLTGLLSSSAVDTLLQPSSGAFVANLWLSMEILQRLAKASGGASATFVNAQAQILSHPFVTADGFPVMQMIWRDMAKSPQRLPEALRLYNADIAKVFEAKYTSQFSTKPTDDNEYLQRDYGGEDCYLKARKVFEEFGVALEAHANEAFRRMGTASRVFARLPGWDSVPFQDIQDAAPRIRYEDYFLSRATLPCSALALQWGRLANRLCGSGSGAAVEFLDYLMDRSKALWVYGNTDKLKANWYSTNRGTHQAVALWAAENEDPTGCIAARLASCLGWLDEVRYYKAMRYVDKVVKSEHRISGLRVPYGAGRSRGLDLLIPQKLDLELFKERLRGAQCGSTREAIESLKTFARKPLKQFIQEGQPQDLPALCAAHPATAIISPIFWQTSRPILYGTSWDLEDRNLRIPETLLGWGLVLDAYHHLVVTHLLLHRVVYPLVDFADICCDEEKPWWGIAFSLLELRYMRRMVLGASSEEVPSDVDSDSDDGEFDYPNPRHITGSYDVREHVTEPTRRPAPIPTSSVDTEASYTKDQRRNLGKKKGKGKGKATESSSTQASQRSRKGPRNGPANVPQVPPQTDRSEPLEGESPTQERLGGPFPISKPRPPTSPKATSPSDLHPRPPTPTPPTNRPARSQLGPPPQTRRESRRAPSPRGGDNQPTIDQELRIPSNDEPVFGADHSRLSDDGSNISGMPPSLQPPSSTSIITSQEFDKAEPTHSTPSLILPTLTMHTPPASPLQGRGINSAPLPPLFLPQSLGPNQPPPLHSPPSQSIFHSQPNLAQNPAGRGNDTLATLGDRSPPPANENGVSHASTINPSPHSQLRIEPPKGAVLVAETQPSVVNSKTPAFANLVWTVPDPHRSEPREYKSITFNMDNNFSQVLRDLGLIIRETQNEIAEDMVIPGILLNGFLSDRLLPGLEGQHSYRPLYDPRYMLQLIEQAEKRTYNAFQQVYRLREAALEYMLLKMVKCVTETTHPPSFILDNLAPLIYNYKLTYLKQVACCIHSYEIPPDQAWAEAVLMASCDKIFSQQSFEWKLNGDLILDVSWTFPAGTTNLEGGGKICVANIERPNASFDRLWSTFTSYTPTAIAQGSTLAEAMARAVTAGPIQAYQNHGYGNGLYVVPSKSLPQHALPVIDEVDWDQASAFDGIVYQQAEKHASKGKAPAHPRMPNVNHQLFQQIGVDRMDYSRRPDAWSGKEHVVAQELGMKLCHPDDGPRTLQSRRSCFSDGDFCRQYPFLVFEARDESFERQLMLRLMEARITLETLRRKRNDKLDAAYKKAYDYCAQKRVERSEEDNYTDIQNIVPGKMAPSPTIDPTRTNSPPPTAISFDSRLSQQSTSSTLSQIEWSSSIRAMQDRSPPRAASIPHSNQEANQGQKRRILDEGNQSRKRAAILGHGVEGVHGS